MDAMSKGITPLPVKAEYFTTQVKGMSEDLKTLDNVEDGSHIEGNKGDLQQLRDELKNLAELAKHMKSDIETKYKDVLNPPNSGGGC